MLAARFTGDPENLTVQEVEKPSINNDDVLVGLKKASICGSDMNYLKGKTSPANIPITLGHEGAGIIEKIGDDVNGFSPGDRVMIHYIESCSRCYQCVNGHDNRCRNRNSIGHHVDGTFAEYISVKKDSVVPLPESISFATASIIGCAGSTAYHALQKIQNFGENSLAVFGVGGVGLHVVKWAEHFGIAPIIAIDPNPHQRNLASKFGAHYTLNPDKNNIKSSISDICNYGVDVSIECSGHRSAMEKAIQAVNGDNSYESGKVISVGIQSEPIELEFDDVREGAFYVSGDHRRCELTEIMNIICEADLGLADSVTHEVKLDNIQSGFDLIDQRNDELVRVAVDI